MEPKKKPTAHLIRAVGPLLKLLKMILSIDQANPRNYADTEKLLSIMSNDILPIFEILPSFSSGGFDLLSESKLAKSDPPLTFSSVTTKNVLDLLTNLQSTVAFELHKYKELMVISLAKIIFYDIPNYIKRKAKLETVEQRARLVYALNAFTHVNNKNQGKQLEEDNLLFFPATDALYKLFEKILDISEINQPQTLAEKLEFVQFDLSSYPLDVALHAAMLQKINSDAQREMEKSDYFSVLSNSPLSTSMTEFIVYSIVATLFKKYDIILHEEKTEVERYEIVRVRFPSKTSTGSVRNTTTTTTTSNTSLLGQKRKEPTKTPAQSPEKTVRMEDEEEEEKQIQKAIDASLRAGGGGGGSSSSTIDMNAVEPAPPPPYQIMLSTDYSAYTSIPVPNPKTTTKTGGGSGKEERNVSSFPERNVDFSKIKTIKTVQLSMTDERDEIVDGNVIFDDSFVTRSFNANKWFHDRPSEKIELVISTIKGRPDKQHNIPLTTSYKNKEVANDLYGKIMDMKEQCSFYASTRQASITTEGLEKDVLEMHYGSSSGQLTNAHLVSSSTLTILKLYNNVSDAGYVWSGYVAFDHNTGRKFYIMLARIINTAAEWSSAIPVTSILDNEERLKLFEQCRTEFLLTLENVDSIAVALNGYDAKEIAEAIRVLNSFNMYDLSLISRK